MSDEAARLIDTINATELLEVLARVKAGDFTARMPLDATGVGGKIADSVNEVIIANQLFEGELTRVSREVGDEGELSQRMAVGGSAQSWSESARSLNNLIGALVRPTSEMQRVIGAVADGDLSKKITADVRGEMLELKNTINAMVDQLNGFISEVTRVVREVGTEGKLGQAAAVTIEVGGVWKELTDNINLMAGNLTGQVRNIAEVTTAVANGDLSQKISVDVKGEFLELKDTVNAMVDQLNAFASEVTRVAREVGVEGKLGGQAQTMEVGGIWKDLTDNVNQLAANLTGQVRAISDVATAVTEGDLTRQVTVEASGEVADLKDKLNEMIRNLRETTRENVEQDWLKTNRERFTRMLQGQRDLVEVSNMILSELAPLVSAQHGVFYSMTNGTDGTEPVLQFQAGYGYEERKNLSSSYRLGQGLVGQCAKEKKRILLTDVPNDYVKINSGLGEARPLNIIALPILFEGSVSAVVELASFSPFTATHQAFLDQLPASIGLVLNTIEADGVTGSLLEQSQSQAEELRIQQEKLSESNEDLARQAKLLADKAEQLSLSSKYKSEFIANMSHELRTPLNSLLMLAEQLEDNPDGNMTDAQVQYANVICSSGNDLLDLLNTILDLAKVESGTVNAELSDFSVELLRDGLLRDFSHVAEGKGLGFSIDLASESPGTFVTDPRRLGQILKNVLANAFKFTERGEVRVSIGPAANGWNSEVKSLTDAPSVLALEVSDTGVGIEKNLQQRIFEAFAQGDGTTARQYGGTGLGLSISRELVRLLSGDIKVASKAGEGSTFTIYLPLGQQTNAASPVVSTIIPGGRTPVDVIAPSDWVAKDPGIAPPRPKGGRIEPGALYGTKVLVVDDDFRNIFAMTALLERGDAEVISAESGLEAIAVLKRKTKVDIVLMDLMMPMMDGYTTMTAIRGLDHCKSLPIIVVTAKVDHDESQRCMDAGASAYVPKPVDTAELVAAMKPWLPASAKKAS